MSEKPLSEQLAEDSMLHLWMSYCGLKQDNELLRDLLREARAEVEWWTPYECNASPDDEDRLSRWFALRDRIDSLIGQRN
jgi:hypothetical protein